MFWRSPLEDSAPVCGMELPPEFSGVIGEFQFRECIYLVYLRAASYGPGKLYHPLLKPELLLPFCISATSEGFNFLIGAD
jgi:hypothetical protein